jgi:hypothetical protein
MTERVFRTPPRAAILTVAFLLGAAFFAAGTALPSASAGAKVGFRLAALLLLLVAIRCARLRIVANADGLKLYGPLFNQTIQWADIRAIVSSETEVDARTFGVRTPIIVLGTGRKVKAQPVSSYSLFGGDGTPADRIAAELEQLRTSRQR